MPRLRFEQERAEGLYARVPGQVQGVGVFTLEVSLQERSFLQNSIASSRDRFRQLYDSRIQVLGQLEVESLLFRGQTSCVCQLLGRCFRWDLRDDLVTRPTHRLRALEYRIGSVQLEAPEGTGHGTDRVGSEKSGRCQRF